jgi:hypothetical protein
VSVIVDRCTIELRGDDAAAFARELRAALPDALGAAFAARPEAGIAVVPVMRMSLSAPLAGIRARDVAVSIAEACAEAAATRCTMIGAASDEPWESAAAAALTALGEGDGVQLDASTEAAAWLVAHARDERSVVRRASPYADAEHLSIGASFAHVALRVGDARALVRALGPTWALRLAERCTNDEARAILRLLRDGDEPSAALRATLAALERAATDARVRDAATHGMHADEPQESGSTGFWLLLPALARCLGDVDDDVGQAVAGALAETLWGPSAADDPAIRAFTGDLPSDGKRLLPPDLRLGRLAVSVVRAFAAELGPFRRARCTYVLRAILSGTGSVRRHGETWYATWPRSPLRIVLERCCRPGPVARPWETPALVTERGDEG